MQKIPKVLGIMSMVLGGLASFSSLIGLVAHDLTKSGLGMMGSFMDKLPRRPGQPSPARMMERAAEATDAMRSYQVTISATLLTLSIAVIIVGFGLLQRKLWSRSAAMIWAVAALLFVPVMAYIQGGIIQPQTQAMIYASMPGGRPDPLLASISQFQIIAAILGTLTFWSPFPIVLLALIAKKTTAKDFEG